jgi:hypothetical protein
MDDESIAEVPALVEEDNPEPVVASTETNGKLQIPNDEDVKKSIQRTVKCTGVGFKTLV